MNEAADEIAFRKLGVKRRASLNDATGKQFGRWKVLRLNCMTEKGAKWDCVCECGTTKTIIISALNSGTTKSCGCKRAQEMGEKSRTHGMTDTRIFRIWTAMKQRCGRKTHVAFNQYGGRGIAVCERWMKFENFLADVGTPPSENHSIDRIDNDKGYQPGNCRWATRSEQQRNRRDNHIICIEGISKTVAEWVESGAVSRVVFLSRIERGWNPKDALNKPPGKYKRKNE